MAGYTAALNVVLLPDAVDVDVGAAVVLRTALDRGLAVLADKHHARDGVGELKEVARDLRDGLDLVQ